MITQTLFFGFTMNLNELNNSVATCQQCGMPATGRECSICHRKFCIQHDHMLALTRTQEMNVAYVCTECIDEHHLQVIDPNHPYYLKYKGEQQ